MPTLHSPHHQNVTAKCDQYAAEVAAGDTLAEVGLRHGVSPAAVFNACKRRGVASVRNRRGLPVSPPPPEQPADAPAALPQEQRKPGSWIAGAWRQK